MSNKSDIIHVRTAISGMRGEIGSVRMELRAEMSGVGAEIIQRRIERLRGEYRACALSLELSRSKPSRTS